MKDELEKECNCGCDECDTECNCECDDECGCGDDDIITLTDDAGEEVDFYQVATLDYQDKWYVFLEPVNIPEGMEEGDLVVFELGEDTNGEDVFLPVEEEKLLEALFQEFDKLVADDEGEENEENE